MVSGKHASLFSVADKKCDSHFDDDDDADDDDDNDDDDDDIDDAKKFRRHENFRKKSLGRHDRFPAKIVEIGAILTIF